MSHSVLLADLRRYREKHVDDRRTARRVFQERVRDGEIPRLRRVKPTASTITAIELYRLEKRRYHHAVVAPAIREAKREMARLDALNKLAHRGGRPKKVVARG